jgi:hypothetical protein
LVQARAAFGDIASQIGDAFQIRSDLQHGGEVSQVSGKRLVQGKNFQALFFDFDFRLIDDAVGGNDFLSKFNLALAEDFCGLTDHPFDASAK